MLETKLFKLLLALNKNELKSFFDFVSSPFFNKNEKVIALYRYIYGFANDFENPKMTFEKAHEAVFGKQAFKKEDLNKIFSMLTDLLKQFIAYTVYEQNPYTAQHYLLTFYNRRGLETNFETEFEKTMQSLDNEPLRNAPYFSNNYKFSQIKHENAAIAKKMDKIVLEKIVIALDSNYYYNKLVLICVMKYQIISKQIKEIATIDIEIENLLSQSAHIKFTTSDLWLSVLNLLMTPSGEKYEFTKKELFSQSAYLDVDNKVFITRVLEMSIDYLNFSYTQLNYEKKEFHKWQLKENLVLHNNIITPYVYRNIIAVSIRCNDLKWAKEFSKDYSSKILPSYTEKTDIAAICNAMIAFEEKKYDEVLDILNVIQISDFGIKIDERNLRLKTYYELQYFDIFEDSVNSYRKFLSENKEKLRENILAGLREFVNSASTIFKIVSKDTKSLGKIQIEIESAAFLPEKIWLLEKIAEKLTNPKK